MCGRRWGQARGEGGAEEGVSGRAGWRRAEWEDAREDGRETGRRVGVRNKKGTPATSSRCLCMRSRTDSSSWGEVNYRLWQRDGNTDRWVVEPVRVLEQRLELVLLFVREQRDDGGEKGGGDAAEVVLVDVRLMDVGRFVLARDGGELGAGVGEPEGGRVGGGRVGGQDGEGGHCGSDSGTWDWQ